MSQQTISIVLGSSQTGLTLKAQLVDESGVNVGGAITTGFTEIGEGNYMLFANISNSHQGGLKILKSDNTLMAFTAINPESSGGGPGVDPLENLVPGDYEEGTAGAALGRIGSAKITTVAPVSVSGDMQVIRGDDYSVDDGASRVFVWSDDENVWPDLDGATITFKCKGVSAEAEFIEGTPNKIRLELTQENTSALPTGRPRFSIVATLGNNHVVTLIIGSIRYVATEGLN